MDFRPISPRISKILNKLNRRSSLGVLPSSIGIGSGVVIDDLARYTIWEKAYKCDANFLLSFQEPASTVQPDPNEQGDFLIQF